jgi:hypothetical protein
MLVVPARVKDFFLQRDGLSRACRRVLCGRGAMGMASSLLRLRREEIKKLPRPPQLVNQVRAYWFRFSSERLVHSPFSPPISHATGAGGRSPAPNGGSACCIPLASARSRLAPPSANVSITSKLPSRRARRIARHSRVYSTSRLGLKLGAAVPDYELRR